MLKFIMMIIKMSWADPIFKISIILMINGAAYLIIESMYGAEFLNYMVKSWYNVMLFYAIPYAIYLKWKERKYGTSAVDAEPDNTT